MGYVFRAEDALRCNGWYQSRIGKAALAIEADLLQRVWSPLSRQSILEVGCGTGVFLEWFAAQGHQVTGIDASPHMLGIARSRLPERVSLDLGQAEDLPYPNNAFDTVALITSLEFVNNPDLAFQEACRVARSHVLVGTLNRYSLSTCRHYIDRLWRPSVYRHARFFSILGLRRLAESVLCGPVPLKWKTCLTFPLWALRYSQWVERSRWLQWHPFGHFIAMRVDLRYPLQTLQHPILTKVFQGAGPNSCHVSVWRAGRRNETKIACERRHRELAAAGCSNRHLNSPVS